MTNLISPYFEEAVRKALDLGHNGAIIAVGNRDQSRIAHELEDFYVTTPEEVLTGNARIPEGKSGLVIIGYVSKPSHTIMGIMGSEEQRLEDWVADQVIFARVTNPEFQVIVLTSKLPDVRIFQVHQYRWANWYPGLDAEGGSVFQLTVEGSLLQARIELCGDDVNRYDSWTTEET
jgi:hypothetical protein